MDWQDVLIYLRNGGITGIRWDDSHVDGICEAVENNACPKLKIYHRGGERPTNTIRFEYGVIGSTDKVAAIVNYLKARPNIVAGEVATNAVATVNAFTFRIGIGGELQYIVFKPLEPSSYSLDGLTEKTLKTEFSSFRRDVSQSGLDILLAGIR